MYYHLKALLNELYNKYFICLFLKFSMRLPANGKQAPRIEH